MNDKLVEMLDKVDGVVTAYTPEVWRQMVLMEQVRGWGFLVLFLVSTVALVVAGVKSRGRWNWDVEPCPATIICFILGFAVPILGIYAIYDAIPRIVAPAGVLVRSLLGG